MIDIQEVKTCRQQRDFLDFPLDLWLEALRGRVPPKLLDLNLKAFELGRNA